MNSSVQEVNITNLEDINRLIDIRDTDTLLKTDLTASLAGLALAAATFLHGRKPEEIPLRSSQKEISKIQQNEEKLNQAKKNFIYSFFGLILCTVVIFGFDFAELGITSQELKVDPELAEGLSKYSIFFISLSLLVRGAIKLYQGIIGVGPYKESDEDMIEKYIEEHEGVGIKEIAKGIRKSNDYVKTVVDELKRDNKIEESGPVFAKKYRVSK